MTPAERHNPKMIDGSRKRRIASGSGTSPQDVNGLLRAVRRDTEDDEGVCRRTIPDPGALAPWHDTTEEEVRDGGQDPPDTDGQEEAALLPGSGCRLARPRDGRYIEQIGRYHPLEDPSVVVIDNDRANYWLSVGAQPSDAVRKLLEISGALAARAAKPTHDPKVHVVGEEAQIEAAADDAELAAAAAAEAVEETVEEAVEEVVAEVEEAAEAIAEAAPETADVPEAEAAADAGDETGKDQA